MMPKAKRFITILLIFFYGLGWKMAYAYDQTCHHLAQLLHKQNAATMAQRTLKGSLQKVGVLAMTGSHAEEEKNVEDEDADDDGGGGGGGGGGDAGGDSGGDAGGDAGGDDGGGDDAADDGGSDDGSYDGDAGDEQTDDIIKDEDDCVEKILEGRDIKPLNTSDLDQVKVNKDANGTANNGPCIQYDRPDPQLSLPENTASNPLILDTNNPCSLINNALTVAAQESKQAGSSGMTPEIVAVCQQAIKAYATYGDSYKGLVYVMGFSGLASALTESQARAFVVAHELGHWQLEDSKHNAIGNDLRALQAWSDDDVTEDGCAMLTTASYVAAEEGKSLSDVLSSWQNAVPAGPEALSIQALAEDVKDEDC